MEKWNKKAYSAEDVKVVGKKIVKKPKEWKKELRAHKRLIALSLIFLLVAVTLDFVAGNYVNRNGAVSVPDLIIDHIPTLDLHLLYIYGFGLTILLFFVYPLFFKVEKLHRVISQFSLLILIRAFFISLTHLAMPSNYLVYSVPAWFALLDFKNAFFFSGHTAFPLLGFLLFRKEKIGIFFLVSTLVLAFTVLFMHVHYSIDVFAAIFITYGSYKFGNWLFGRVNHY